MAPSKKRERINEALILEVQSHPSLWDKKSKVYKDLTVKSNSWNEILLNLRSSFSSDELFAVNMTAVKQVKDRWKSLRKVFGRTKKNAKGKSGSGNFKINFHHRWAIEGDG